MKCSLTRKSLGVHGGVWRVLHLWRYVSFSHYIYSCSEKSLAPFEIIIASLLL